MLFSKFSESTFSKKRLDATSMLFFIWIVFELSAPVSAKTLDLKEFKGGVIGKHLQYIQEQQALSVSQARTRFLDGKGKQSNADSISLGIGVAPVWLQVTIDNPISEVKSNRLSIETPWLDYIDVWLLRDGVIVKQITGGDAVPYEQRPMQYRNFAFEYDYEPGKTELLIRIESLGPMAIPIRLSSIDKAVQRDISSAYQYGVLYGVMSALALYNIVLYVYIRQREFGLYGVYLLGFVINSLSYTGQLHTVITADFGKYFQDWLDIFLMITYSVAGLHFARTLLKTKDYAPNLDKTVKIITTVIPVGMLIGFVFNQLVFSMSLAFILNCGFVTLFVAMGFYAQKARKPLANIFIISSITAAVCITISTLAVAGLLVPYNDYTFKAIEVGMTFEAMLLAVILAKQFRIAQADKVLAEVYARTDTLTSLNNRRGFEESTQPLWNKIIREQRDASIVLFDIDDFKKVNDSYGHSTGDLVLQHVSDVVKKTLRDSDVCGRWGGEEFIIMLPETSVEQAARQAERLRMAFEQSSISVGTITIPVTASFGVSGSLDRQFNEEKLTSSCLEKMIKLADTALYRAKRRGKNRVMMQFSEDGYAESL